MRRIEMREKGKKDKNTEARYTTKTRPSKQAHVILLTLKVKQQADSQGRAMGSRSKKRHSRKMREYGLNMRGTRCRNYQDYKLAITHMLAP